MVFKPLLILLLASPAGAVFQSSDMELVDHEPLLDTEYFLDLASFRPALVWDEEHRTSTSNVSYRVNAASIDCCDLFMQQRARLRRRLSSATDFRFVFTQRGDKDKEETRHLLELERRLPGGVGFIFFGEPHFNKEDSDIGMGLRWGPFQVRRNFVDFTFNKRSPPGDKYSRDPLTDQLFVDLPDAYLAVEADHPTRRNTFFYRRTALSTEWRPGGWTLGYTYEYQRKADTATAEDNKRWAHYGRLARRLGEEWEAGLTAVSRRSRTQGLRFYRRLEAQPYARWRKSLLSYLESEVATFLAFGRHDDERVAEAKLGLGLDWKFGANGRVGVYGTFDLDNATKHLWDGGKAQAQIFF